MSTTNLSPLCTEYLSKAIDEKISIQKKIDNRYLKLKNDKDFKNKLKSEFQKDIEDFKDKYRNNLFSVVNPETNEIIGIDSKCSEKAKELSKYLENYIDNIID